MKTFLLFSLLLLLFFSACAEEEQEDGILSVEVISNSGNTIVTSLSVDGEVRPPLSDKFRYFLPAGLREIEMRIFEGTMVHQVGPLQIYLFEKETFFLRIVLPSAGDKRIQAITSN